MCETVCKVPSSVFLLSLLNVDLKGKQFKDVGTLSEAMLVISKLHILISQHIHFTEIKLTWPVAQATESHPVTERWQKRGCKTTAEPVRELCGFLKEMLCLSCISPRNTKLVILIYFIFWCCGCWKTKFSIPVLLSSFSYPNWFHLHPCQILFFSIFSLSSIFLTFLLSVFQSFQICTFRQICIFLKALIATTIFIKWLTTCIPASSSYHFKQACKQVYYSRYLS